MFDSGSTNVLKLFNREEDNGALNKITKKVNWRHQNPGSVLVKWID